MQWEHKNGKLTTKITFQDQTKLAEYMLKVAQYSDAVEHHADMEINYNQLTISLYTHDTQMITEKDYKLAKKLQELK